MFGLAWCLAGDSLTGEMIDTLAIILRAELLDHGTGQIVSFVGCDGRLPFSFYRNDFLDTRTTEESGGFPTEHCEEPDISSRCVVFAGKTRLFVPTLFCFHLYK